MRKYFLIIFVLINSLFTYSQENKIKAKKELSEREFEEIIRNNFSKVITNNSINSIGNYLSIDVEKTNLDLASNFIFKNGNIVNAKISGGVTDGIMSVFNNSKLNTNVNFELNYNFLFNKVKKAIVYKKEDFETFIADSLKAQNEYLLELEKINLNIKNNNLIEKNNELKIKINKNKQELTKLNNELEKDKLKYEIFKDSLELESNLNMINSFNRSYEKLKVGNKRAEAFEKNRLENLKIIGIKMAWFTLSYKLKNDNFKLFDSAELYENQIQKINSISHNFKMQFTSVNLNSAYDKSNYFTSSITYSSINNLENLKSFEIEEIKLLSNNSNSERKVNSKTIVYTGDFEEKLNQIKINLEYFHFFSNSRLGLHLFPVSRYVERTKPNYSFGLGIIAPFKNLKSNNSLLNLELYYNFIDIFNSNKSDYDLFERNDIGFRITFPFNF